MVVSLLVRRGTPLLLALVALTACGEAATAPSLQPDLDEAAPLLSAANSGPHNKPKKVKAHKTYDADSKNTVYSFTIDPTVAQLVRLGDHEVILPANVVCDPSTSGYGSAEWEKPCTLARAAITFRAITGTRHGHAAIEFEPDVRFVPGSTEDPGRSAVLTLRDVKKLNDKTNYSILWWDADAESNSGSGSDKGAWVDEAATDPTLRAWTDRGGNRVSRRLKHFSGYNVTSGRSEQR
jgi:hypothetical protein